MVRVTKLVTPSGVGVELGPLSGDLRFLARNLHILLRNEAQPIRQSMGIDPGVASILSVVWLNPGISQNDLAATIALRKAAITKLVKKMEADGLLSRRRTTQDRRMNSLMLTETGQQMIAKIRPLAASMHDSLFAGIDDADREIFFDVLSQLVDRLAGQAAPLTDEDDDG